MCEKESVDAIKHIEDVSLILEGGGMRGIYTTGVLDAFLDKALHFKTVIGVSAGASHALSYLSKQRGRARRVNVEYCHRKDYMGLSCLLKEGSLFGMNLLFNKIPYELDLFDFDTYFSFDHRYIATLTNIDTGEAEYFEPKNGEELLEAAMASCSLPFVSKPVTIQSNKYLDGGISDSIPIKKMEALGFTKHVIVLTQPKGFRKTKSSSTWWYFLLYPRHKNLIKTLKSRNSRYNATLDYIDELEKQGKALVIRPLPQPGLDRLEKDKQKLDGLYKSGYEDALKIVDKIRAL